MLKKENKRKFYVLALIKNFIFACTPFGSSISFPYLWLRVAQRVAQGEIEERTGARTRTQRVRLRDVAERRSHLHTKTKGSFTKTEFFINSGFFDRSDFFEEHCSLPSVGRASAALQKKNGGFLKSRRGALRAALEPL
jgi:hypothetical protein